MIKALLWSEWRRQRNMIMLLAAGTVALWLVVILLLRVKLFPMQTIELGALLFPPLAYALLLGAEAFSAELKDRNISFLLSLPVSANRIYWIRYAFNLSLVAVLTAMNTTLWMAETGQSPSTGNYQVALFLLLSTHTAVMTCSLLGHGLKYSVVALPCLIVLWVAGIFLAEALIAGTKHKTDAFIAWMGFLWLALLFFSRYLWVRRQATGRSAMKPALWALGIGLAFPILLFLLCWGYAEIQLQYAIRQATAAGLIMTHAQAAEPPPSRDPQHNASPWLLQFEEKLGDYSKKFLYSNNLAYRFDEPPRSAKDPLQWRQKIFRDYAWLEKPALVAPLEQIVQHITSSTSCVCLAPDKPPSRCPEFGALWSLKDFLTYQAMNAAFRGRDQDFFKLLAQFPRVAVLARQVPFSHNRGQEQQIRFRMLRLAIVLGPETPAAAAVYRKMLTAGPTMAIATHNSIWMDELTSWYSMSPIDASVRRPRVIMYVADNLLADIEEEKLLQPPVSLTTLQKFKTEHHLVATKNFHPSRVHLYLRMQTRLDAYRLALALRIYHIEHGVWPETLSKLVPELLPEIPLDALEEKPFVYELNADGFTIASENKIRKSAITSYIFYYPWRELAKQETGK